MKRVADHLSDILGTVRPLSPLDVQIFDAHGCVLTEDVELAYLSYTSVTAMGPGCTPSGGRPIGTAQPADAYTICCAG